MPLKSIAPTVLQPYQSNNPVDMDWLSTQLSRMEGQQQEARDTAFKTELAMQSLQPLEIDKEVFDEMTGRIAPQLEELAGSDLTPGQMQYESRRMGKEHSKSLAPFEARSLAYHKQKKEYEDQGQPGDMVELAMAEWQRENLKPLDPNGDNFGTVRGESRILADHVDLPQAMLNYANNIDDDKWNIITNNGDFNYDLALENFGQDGVDAALRSAGIDKSTIGKLDGAKVTQLKASLIRDVIERALASDPGIKANVADRVELTIASKDPEDLQNELEIYKKQKKNETDIEFQDALARLNAKGLTGEAYQNELEALIARAEDKDAKYNNEEFDVGKYVEEQLIEPLIENTVMMKARTDTVLNYGPTGKSRQGAVGGGGSGTGAPGYIKSTGRQQSAWGKDADSSSAVDAIARIKTVEVGKQGAMSDKEYRDILTKDMTDDERLSYNRDRKILDYHDRTYDDVNGAAIQRIADKMNAEDSTGNYTKEDVYDIFRSESGTKEGVREKSTTDAIRGMGPVGAGMGTVRPPGISPKYEKLSPEVRDLIEAERDAYRDNLTNFSGDGTNYVVAPDEGVTAVHQAHANFMAGMTKDLTVVLQNDKLSNDGWFTSKQGPGGEEDPNKRDAALHDYIMGGGEYGAEGGAGAAFVESIKTHGEILPMEITFNNKEGQSLVVQIENPSAQQDLLNKFGFVDEAKNTFLYTQEMNDNMDNSGSIDLPNTSTSAADGPSRVVSLGRGKRKLGLVMSGYEDKVTVGQSLDMMQEVIAQIPPVMDKNGSWYANDDEIKRVKGIVAANVKNKLNELDVPAFRNMRDDLLMPYIDSLATSTSAESAESQEMLIELDGKFPGIAAAMAKILKGALEFNGRGAAASYERLLAKAIQ